MPINYFITPATANNTAITFRGNVCRTHIEVRNTDGIAGLQHTITALNAITTPQDGVALTPVINVIPMSRAVVHTPSSPTDYYQRLLDNAESWQNTALPTTVSVIALSRGYTSDTFNMPYKEFIRTPLDYKALSDFYMERCRLRRGNIQEEAYASLNVRDLHEYNGLLISNPGHEFRLIKIMDRHYIYLTNTSGEAVLNNLARVLTLDMLPLFPEELQPPIKETLYDERSSTTCNAIINEYVVENRLRDLSRNAIPNISAALSTLHQDKKDSLLNKIQDTETSIAECLDRMEGLNRRLFDFQLQLSSSYWSNSVDPVSTFLKHLTDTKTKSIMYATAPRLSSAQLIMLLQTTLDYFDESNYVNFRDSSRTNFINKRTSTEIELLNRLFVKQSIIFYFQTGIYLNLANGEYGFANTPIDSMKSSFGNPHITHFNCFGNNKTLIAQAYQKQDFVIMYEQIRAALSNLNTVDSVVFERFTNEIFNNNSTAYTMYKPIYDRTTKIFYSMSEYLQIIQEELKNETTQS